MHDNGGVSHKTSKGDDGVFQKLTMMFRKEIIGLVNIRGILTNPKVIVDEIRRFEKRRHVKAIVLRIDSPGGGVVAAQEVSEAVKRARGKKPVVASLGSVAASGGYYIACSTEKIYANPGTITGSIGVIMQLHNVEMLLKKVGMESSVLKAGDFKDAGSPLRRITPRETKHLQGMLDSVHSQFIDAVASGREMDPEAVIPLADGRIFIGEEAKGLGLVDEIGGLQRTIDETARRVGIRDEPRVVSFRRRRRRFFLDTLFNRLSGSVWNQAVHGWEGPMYLARPEGL